MKYKLLISDFDGTLAPSGSTEIDKDTISAIKEYEKAGGKFVICTGRPFTSLKKITDKYGLNGLAVTIQGAVIRDIKSGEALIKRGLDTETAISVINEYRKENFEHVLYLDDEMYYDKDGYFVELYQSILKVKGVKVDDLVETVKNSKVPVSKLCVVCEPEKTTKYEEIFNERFNGKGVIFNSGAKILIEAVNPLYTKGSAVKFLMDYYSLTPKEVMTVGDSTNDVTLVKGEWHGVAVGDGKEMLKKVAKEITVPLKDKPIKYLIEKYCLH